jgi:hypothetical protein
MTDPATPASPAVAPAVAAAGYTKLHSHPAGPATLDCTEFGESFESAMVKIDAMFHKVFSHIAGVAPAIDKAVTTVDTDARKAITDLEAKIKELTAQHDALVASISSAAPAVAAVNPNAAANPNTPPSPAMPG